MHGENIPRERTKKSKIIKIAIIIAAAILLLLALTAYLFIQSYIHKLNLVIATDKQDPVPKQITQTVILPDETEPGGADATEAQVKTLEDKVRENMEKNSTPVMQDKDVFHILLIGSDSRTVREDGRSDAMILVSINKKTKSLIATSILRDIYLSIPGVGNNRVNAAYAYGGADLLLDTLEQNLKIHVDRYASIDFYSFMEVIDALDGITLEVTQEEIPIINKYITSLNKLTGQQEEDGLLTEPGILSLNGKQALGYARNRYIGMDFERTARQRRVLEKVFEKVKKSNLIELNRLLNIILPQVTTNLTQGEIFSLLLKLPDYKNYEITQWSVPVEGSYSFLRIRGMDVIDMDFDKNISEINKRIFGELPGVFCNSKE
jgi:LCP family protein required for cell wall assembly